VENKKFTAVEIVIGVSLALLIDVVALLLDLLIIGWVLATLLQAGASFATTLWLMMKGGKKATKLTRQLLKQFSNLLPWVPTVTFSFIIETILHNHEGLKKIKKIKTLTG